MHEAQIYIKKQKKNIKITLSRRWYRLSTGGSLPPLPLGGGKQKKQKKHITNFTENYVVLAHVLE